MRILFHALMAFPRHISSGIDISLKDSVIVLLTSSCVVVASCSFVALNSSVLNPDSCLVMKKSSSNFPDPSSVLVFPMSFQLDGVFGYPASYHLPYSMLGSHPSGSESIKYTASFWVCFGLDLLSKAVERVLYRASLNPLTGNCASGAVINSCSPSYKSGVYSVFCRRSCSS